MDTLSIVIPNYNYGRYADRFFSSLAEQSMALDKVEILFVDDGSTDDSIAQAELWAERIKCRSFKIFTPPRCGKPGPVRNYGLERAEGSYLVSLDPDDTLCPEFLERCVAELEREEGISLVFTDYLERQADSGKELRLPDFKPLYLRTQNTLPPTAVYRRDVWDAGVRYRDNTAYEDWDFWIQCLMVGAKFKRIPEILYNYEIHDTNFSYSAVREDGAAKAQIVLNNSSFFNPAVVQWAQDHLRGRDYAPAFRRGYIPTPDDIRKVMELFDKR